MTTEKSKINANLNILVLGSEPFAWDLFKFLNSFSYKILYLNITGNNLMRKMFSIFCFLLLLKKIDYIYTIGYFKPNSIFYKLPRLFHKEIIVHWIGSEVLHLKAGHYRKFYGSFSVSNNLLHELDSHSIKSRFLPLFFPFDSKIDSLRCGSPSSHGILFYLVLGEESFYGLEYLRLLARIFKETPFYVIGTSRIKFTEGNIYNMGYLDKQPLEYLFSKVTIYVRITKHDGLSQLILKSLSLGKVVISNTIHPFVQQFNPAKDNSDVLIRLVRNILEKDPVTHRDSIDYIKNFYSYSEQVRRYRIAFEELGIRL